LIAPFLDTNFVSAASSAGTRRSFKRWHETWSAASVRRASFRQGRIDTLHSVDRNASRVVRRYGAGCRSEISARRLDVARAPRIPPARTAAAGFDRPAPYSAAAHPNDGARTPAPDDRRHKSRAAASTLAGTSWESRARRAEETGHPARHPGASYSDDTRREHERARSVCGPTPPPDDIFLHRPARRRAAHPGPRPRMEQTVPRRNSRSLREQRVRLNEKAGCSDTFRGMHAVFRLPPPQNTPGRRIARRPAHAKEKRCAIRPPRAPAVVQDMPVHRPSAQ
jgi:hypothetical protein